MASTETGLCNLLSYLSYCQDRAGDENNKALIYPMFLQKFTESLPQPFREKFQSQCLLTDDELNFGILLTFVTRSLRAIERNPKVWKTEKSQNKNITNMRARSNTMSAPHVSFNSDTILEKSNKYTDVTTNTQHNATT